MRLRRSWTAASIGGAAVLTGVVFVLAFLPAILVLAMGLWAPVALNHESFSLFYVTYPMLRRSYHFFRNAHFFTLLFAYPPSLLVSLLPQRVTVFDKFQIFSLFVYALNGAVLTLLCVRALRSILAPVEKALLLFVALGHPFLSTRLINLLTINYHMLEAILYVALAFWYIRWLGDERACGPSPRWLGLVFAIAVGTKLTLLVVMAPFLALLALPWGAAWRRVIRDLGVFVASAAVAGAVLLQTYLLFRVQYLRRFLRDLIRLNRDPRWRDQTSPWVTSELGRWLRPDSTLFGFHVIVTVFALGLLGLVVLAWMNGLNSKVRRFLFCTAGVTGFLGYLLWRRTAPNTVLDIILFLAFEVAVLGSIYLRQVHTRIPGWVALSVLLVAGIAQVGVYYRPLRVIEGLRVADGIAREVDAMERANLNLPVILYQTYVGPSMIFPSVHLYSTVSGGLEALEDPDLEPRVRVVRVVKPAEGLYAAPHVMIAPEYFDPVPPTLDSWERVRVFGTFPPFDEILRDPENTCRVFDLAGARRYVDAQFRTEPTRVTACVVRRVPPVVDYASVVAPPHAIDLARGRRAWQSSTLNQGQGELAVAGDSAGPRSRTKLAHTQYELQPWWEVDLGEVRPIAYVQVWNRPDCCQDRLRAFHVFVSDNPFAWTSVAATRQQHGVADYYVSGPAGRPTTIPVGHRGRYVRIQLSEGGVLVLAEVNVLEVAPVKRESRRSGRMVCRARQRSLSVRAGTRGMTDEGPRRRPLLAMSGCVLRVFTRSQGNWIGEWFDVQESSVCTPHQILARLVATQCG